MLNSLLSCDLAKAARTLCANIGVVKMKRELRLARASAKSGRHSRVALKRELERLRAVDTSTAEESPRSKREEDEEQQSEENA